MTVSLIQFGRRYLFSLSSDPRIFFPSLCWSTTTHSNLFLLPSRLLCWQARSACCFSVALPEYPAASANARPSFIVSFLFNIMYFSYFFTLGCPLFFAKLRMEFRLSVVALFWYFWAFTTYYRSFRRFP